MADSLKNILDSPSNSFSVFEPNQVLASDHLNSLAAYLNYQEHLTRARLLGVGIVGGLHVSLSDNSVRVTKGVGVTTDGDLLTLAVDTTFNKFKKYGEAAPRYAPFYAGEAMRTIFELVREDQADDATEALAAFPGNLAEMVVVMLMERCEDDPDLCSGTDCDNLGKTAIDTPRLLLVSRGDAAALATVLETVRQAALKLPVLDAARPVFSKNINTTRALAEVFREACGNIHAALTGNLDALHGRLPAFTQQVFGGDPAVGWKTVLAQHKLAFAGNRDKGIQYYYDFLKDLVDTWNELREALLADDLVLCPDVAAFPRHLLLGDLTNPRESRTGWFSSPLTSGNRDPLEQARFLARKLNAQISLFVLPDNDPNIRITPSYSEAARLEDRAIPCYYPAVIRETWNYRRTQRGESAGIYGYHTSGPEVFGRQIGRFEFFRVEGHLGKNATEVKTTIEKAIAGNNLPFAVRAVLLHDDRRRIIIRPPIRYGDLHRLHHLLRKELTVQLAETRTFNENFKAQLNVAVQNKNIPGDMAGNLNLSAQVKDAADEAEPVLAKAKFSEYQLSRQAQDWRGGFKTVVNVANNFKATLGDITRNNYVTAFDSLLTNNHPAWLEWLETLIQSKDDQEDDKLLFPNFCQQHPGLEHFGGAPRGGTFVLIYDDQGRVVADFALAYNWVETADDEPQEPEQLTAPSYKLPNLFEGSVKVIPPLDMTFDQRFVDFESKLKRTLFKDQVDSQNKQLDYLKQFVQVLGSRSAVGGGAIDPRRDIADPVLRSHLEELDYKRRQVDDLRNVVLDPATPPDVRERTSDELKRVELELANSIKRSSTLIDTPGISLQPGSDGSKAIVAISQGMEKVSGDQALEMLRNVSAGVNAPQLKQAFALRGL